MSDEKSAAEDFDDGFEEIERATTRSVLAPCTMICTAVGRTDGKKKARRVSITFRVDMLAPEARDLLLRGPRFAVAYNPASGTVRLRACDTGAYELTRAPRGRSAEPSQTYLLRFPFPARGMEWCAERAAVDVDVNLTQRALLIDVPAGFRERAQPRTPVPAPPPPPQTPLAERRRLARRAAHDFPLEVSKKRFEPLEARLIGALYHAAESLSRSELLEITRDEDLRPDRDGRDIYWVDHTVKKIRPRLFDLQIAVLNDAAGTFRLSPTHKSTLRNLLADAVPGV